MGVCIVDILLSAIHSLLLWLVNTVPDDKNRFWRRRAPCEYFKLLAAHMVQLLPRASRYLRACVRVHERLCSPARSPAYACPRDAPCRLL